MTADPGNSLELLLRHRMGGGGQYGQVSGWHVESIDFKKKT